MNKCLWVVLVSLIVVSAAAAKSIFPLQCKVSGLQYKNSKVILFAQHTTKPRLYAIQNNSKNVVWLSHERGNRGVGAGWDSRLNSQHWSALLMTRPKFDLTCHIQKPKSRMKAVPCKQVLRICQFSWLYSKNPLSGGYWVGENLPLPDLMKRIRERRFEV